MQTLADIWLELGDRVRRFVNTRVSDSHAADDIAQDVMLKIQSRVDQLPADEKLASWVFAIARNAIVDHYRAAAVREHADIASAEEAVEDDRADLERAVRELSPCLGRMVEQLPEPYREAMKLSDLEGVTQQEIADRAGISLSGAKSRVQRARQMMREMLLDCCNVERDVRGNVFDYETTERTGKYCGPGEAPGDRGCGSNIEG
jgi:RNA polymerase sigma-70 factor (ECF subfamily)